MKRGVLLSGYYGFGNLGDEALLETVAGEIGRRHPGMPIEVLSATPERTSEAYGIRATARNDLRGVRDAIERASVVVSGGGGLLQNATSTRSLAYYCGVIRAATGAGRGAMIFAQSIGPLDRFGRLIVAATCRGVSAATVRDERSRILLQTLLPQVPVRLCADPVFMIDVARDTFDFAAEGLGPESDPIAIVSVRRIPNFESGVPALAAAVDRLAELGAKVAFLPLGGAQDADASTVVIRKCRSAPVLLPAYELAKAARVISRARVVVGMRLHALIIAARLGIPFAAIPYDPKVAALCEQLAWPLPPLWDPLGSPASPEHAIDVVERLWNERDLLAAALTPQIERLRSLARENFDVLDELLERPEAR